MERGTRLAHFELVEPLGAGGMGEVWRARDLKLKRDVAVKLLPDDLALDDDAMARLHREAELMAAVQHPNIASIFSIEEIEREGPAGRFLVIELVEGQTLAERLGNGPLSVGEACAIGAQIARAVHAAHDRGVVHRDLKPANVMLGPRGRVKVLDFGIAKPSAAIDVKLTSAPTSRDATATGALVGTVPYMSPEQVRGRAADGRTDIWALGCLLYEMLTGKPAFAGNNPGDVLAAIVAEEPRWEALPDPVPPALRDLLRELLQKDPESRTWTATEVRRALESLQGGAVQLRSVQSRVRPILGAAVAMALVATALVWMLGGSRGPGERVGSEGALSLAEVHSVVALPPALQDGVDEVFSGAHETFTNYVAGLDDVAVREPPSLPEVEPFAGDLPSIASEYRVDAFLLSTVMVGADGTVLQVRLTDPRSGNRLWGRDYRQASGSAAELIAQAGAGIRSALRPGSTPVGPERLPTVNREAMAKLNSGRVYAEFYNYGRDEADLERADTALQEALQLDPTLADAAAWLAWLAQIRYEENDPSALEDLGLWANTAVRLDPESAMAWNVISIWTLSEPGKEREALEASLRAVSLSPDTALVHFGLAHILYPSAALSAAAQRRVWELDPLNLYVRSGLAGDPLARGAPFEQVRPHLEHIRRMRPGNAFFAVTWLRALTQLGDRAGMGEELQLISAAADQVLAPVPAACAGLVAVYDALQAGDDRVLDAALDEYLRLIPSMHWYYNPEITMEVIGLLSRAGRYSRAEAVLEASLENPQMLLQWDVYETRPDIQPLRGTTAMDRALEQSRALVVEVAEVLEEARLRGELPEYLLPTYLETREGLGLDG